MSLLTSFVGSPVAMPTADTRRASVVAAEAAAVVGALGGRDVTAVTATGAPPGSPRRPDSPLAHKEESVVVTLDKTALAKVTETSNKVAQMVKTSQILKILGAIFLSLAAVLAIAAAVALFLMPHVAIPVAIAAGGTAAIGLSLLIGRSVVESNIQKEAVKFAAAGISVANPAARMAASV